MKKFIAFVNNRPLHVAAFIICTIVFFASLSFSWVIATLCLIAFISVVLAQSKLGKMERRDQKFSKIIEVFGSFDQELQDKILGFLKEMEIDYKQEKEARNNFNSARKLFVLKSKELENLKQKVIEATVAKKATEKPMEDAESILARAREELKTLEAKIS